MNMPDISSLFSIAWHELTRYSFDLKNAYSYVAWKEILAACLVFLILSLIYIWYWNPAVIVTTLLKYNMYKIGIVTQYYYHEGRTVCVAQKNKADPREASFLLIHGITSSKEMWIPFIERLPKKKHVVLVDLPGHGGTSLPPENVNPDFYYLTYQLHESLKICQLQHLKYHVIGISLGGAIAALFARAYPKLCDILTLVCPAMQTPVESEFIKQSRYGKCALLPQSLEEMRDMVTVTCYYNHKIPNFIFRGAYQLRVYKHDYFSKLFYTVIKLEEKEKAILQDGLREIQAPTSVVWGNNDKVLDVSGAYELELLLPNIRQIDIIDECGHSCNMDQPDKLVQCCLKFHYEYACRMIDHKLDYT